MWFPSVERPVPTSSTALKSFVFTSLGTALGDRKLTIRIGLNSYFPLLTFACLFWKSFQEFSENGFHFFFLSSQHGGGLGTKHVAPPITRWPVWRVHTLCSYFRHGYVVITSQLSTRLYVLIAYMKGETGLLLELGLELS